MPVTSPSYFPPSRGTDQIVGLTSGRAQTGARVFLGGQSAGANSTISDFIAIGNNVASGGLTSSLLVGLTAIGSGALSALQNPNGVTPGSNTAFGYNTGHALIAGNGNVYIGDSAASKVISNTGVPSNYSVVIGSRAALNIGASSDNVRLDSSVIIGYEAARSSINGDSVTASVIIGYQAARLAASIFPAALQSAVIIGSNAGTINLGTGGSTRNIVAIGCNLDGGVTCTNLVAIGDGLQIESPSTFCVAVGDGIVSTGFTKTTVIGSNASGGAGSGNIILGHGAGLNNGAGVFNDVFNVETYDPGGTLKRLIVGNLSSGSMVLGNAPHDGTDTLVGTNSVKLVNGTKGANPTGGGYFYVVAGALHWVGPSGTDTVIAPA